MLEKILSIALCSYGLGLLIVIAYILLRDNFNRNGFIGLALILPIIVQLAIDVVRC